MIATCKICGKSFLSKQPTQCYCPGCKQKLTKREIHSIAITEYQRELKKIFQKMKIQERGLQEERHCYNCGKVFTSNTVKMVRKKMIVTGEFTCCWRCTQALIDRGEL